MIKHEGGKWILYSMDGSKKLGVHSSEADAQAQERLIQAKTRNAEHRDLHLLGAVGKVTTEMVGGKEYLVVPVVALMEGVIHAVNAETPEFVPFETLRKCAESWNGKPITIGHPKGSDGKQCSASESGIWDAHGIGKIRNARVDVASKKMLMEALIEKDRAKKLHPDMYQRLAEGGTEEVSVGAMVVSDHKTGKHGAKPFVGSWTHAEGDHLAFLPGGRGACSVEMGCGTHRAAMMFCEGVMELVTLDNPEGINQYTHGGGGHQEGDRVRINMPGHESHGKVGVISHSNGSFHGVTTPKSVSSKGWSGGKPLGTFHESNLKALEEREMQSIIDPDTLRCLRDIPQAERDKMSDADFAGPGQSFPIKTQADVDAASHLVGKAKDPAAVKAKVISIAKKKGLKLPDAWMKAAEAGDATEEEAELIAYQSMRTVLDGVEGQFEEISKLVDALIADETENPTETPEEEVAEEQIETARLDAIRTMCQSLSAALNSVISATYCQSLSDSPRYMAALAGARHSKSDMTAIQAVHDHSMTLGATCDRSNYKQLGSNIEDKSIKLDVTKMNDDSRKLEDNNQRYIAQVRQRAAGAR